MNRLRGKKKAKEEQSTPRPSVESESSGPFKMFGKNKKALEEEPKKDVDLATALPSTDDFRTSLLMTGLSARFSMLREQDDPSSKLGKASDDSVLFPKRQSRLDFGLASGLGDIAEVESIRAPAFTRMDSYQSSDDAASTAGSILNRGKPVEGNNLFGGRQKIYKIPAGGSSSGGLSGRTLYDGDVAQSAFQKWRQSERERQSTDMDQHDDAPESESARPESPVQVDFNRRRETNSTTSSGAARNSTAATSITSSQPGSSVKDRPPSTTASSSVSPNLGGDRTTVIRTRRLYEQSLNQDLYDQQSTATSRIDTLSRQRAFGTRTPDLTPTLNSPTSTIFSERFADRRPILSKASAPNLRSFSPAPIGSSQTSPADPSRHSGLEVRTSFGQTPPLSPPISESEERNNLPIEPNDRGKATAMGVFNRPAEKYDESRYAQRQLQMQRGRETPTNLVRTESGDRSRSSSAQRTPFEKHDSATLKPEPTVQEETSGATFLDDSDAEDDQSVEAQPAKPQSTSRPTPPRPDDHDHPAFRDAAIPTRLAIATSNNTSMPAAEEPNAESNPPTTVSPVDSPTLGPGSGLSGMVRQHLRNESTDSSIYDGAPEEVDLAARFPPGPPDMPSFESLASKSNPWESNEGDWAISLDGSELSPTRSGISNELHSPDAPTTPRDSKSTVENEKEPDEFARHLADGARRVRERLNSYAEFDHGKTASSTSNSEIPNDLQPPPRLNGLGILKSKSSRGSLIDKTRGDREQHSGLIPKKLLGIGSSTMTSTPSPRRSSFETKDESPKQDQPRPELTSDQEGNTDEQENVHAGLKAFRQARRELQKMKEIDVQHRYQSPPPAPVAALPRAPQAGRERAGSTRAGSRPGSRAQSREGGHPPVAYNRKPSEEMRSGMGSRSGSRAPSERDRSGSEASNSGRSRSRPARLRNGSLARDEQQQQPSPMGTPGGPNGMPRQGPMMRSPGLPGTDIKRSPHMPPQPYPGSPGRINRPMDPTQNLTVQPVMGREPGQPSPISPLSGHSANFGAQQFPPAQPSNSDPIITMEQHVKRMVRKRDISEPTFVSTTSQVPTVQLEGAQGTRSRNGSLISGAASTPNLHGNSSAPPLPPINPRRKNMFGGLLRRSEDETSLGSPNSLKSPRPMEEGHGSTTINDEEVGPAQFRQRLRKATSEANSLNSRATSTRHNPPQPLARPPPPRAMTGNMPGGMI